MALSAAATFFGQQVGSDTLTQDLFYGLASVCLILVVLAIGLIDGGLVRRKNVLDTWVTKLVCAVLAGGAFLIIGYGIWNWQFYSALGIPNPLSQAIKDWWIGGPNMTTFAQNLDPKLVPQADVFQVFVLFFVAYAMVIGALIHSAGVERVKRAPLIVLSVIGGGIAMPVMTYLTWGSASFLTNSGTHDFLGVYSLYIFVGVWALILAWRAGPRLGAFVADKRTIGPVPHNLGMSASGAALLLFCVPFLAAGCGYFVSGQGYFGIAMSSSGIGIVAINIAAAYAGGIIGGGLLSWRTRNPLFVLLGPAAGYVGTGTVMDVLHPWVVWLIAMFAPLALYATYRLLLRLRIDEKKIVPLGLGCGLYSVVVGGFVAWHTKTGGYFGLKGHYGFQHAEIGPGMQLAGAGVTIAIAAISGLVLIVGLEKTIGLRVSEKVELEGLDAHSWLYPPSDHLDLPVASQNGIGDVEPASEPNDVPGAVPA
jgi:ammonium transporter, Amt family